MFGLFKKRQPTRATDEAHPQHRNFARLFIPDGLGRQRGAFWACCLMNAQAGHFKRPGGKFGANVLLADALTAHGVERVRFQARPVCAYSSSFLRPKLRGDPILASSLRGLRDGSAAALATVPVRYFLLERSTNSPPFSNGDHRALARNGLSTLMDRSCATGSAGFCGGSFCQRFYRVHQRRDQALRRATGIRDLHLDGRPYRRGRWI